MEGKLRYILCALALGISMLLTLDAARAAGTPHPSHACVYDSQMLTSPSRICRPRAISYPSTVDTGVQKAIYDASLLFGVPYNLLEKVAQCESGLNPKARGHGYFGLFQFAPSTFRRGAAQMRADTGVPAKSYWSARDSSYVAAYLFAIGKAPSWSCTSEIGQP